jgi:hypothetical protein
MLLRLRTRMIQSLEAKCLIRADTGPVNCTTAAVQPEYTRVDPHRGRAACAGADPGGGGLQR